MVAHWVDWATAVVETWPDDVRDGPFDAAEAAESVRLAESIAEVVGPAAGEL